VQEYQRVLLPLYTAVSQGQHQGVIPVKPQQDSRKITVCGGVFATFDECLLGLDAQGRPVSEMRGSGTMLYDKESDSWSILQYHMSMPIPNEAALAVSRHLQQPHPFPESQEHQHQHQQSQQVQQSPQVQQSQQVQPPLVTPSALETVDISSTKKKKKKKDKK
jgi:hypothetical protein